MTLYNQHTFTAVFVSQTGHSHVRSGGDDGTPMAIDCGACEPFLTKDGWVYDPKLVPLTDRQMAEQERVSKQGNAALLAFQRDLAANAASALLEGGAPAKAPRPRAARPRAPRATRKAAATPRKAAARTGA